MLELQADEKNGDGCRAGDEPAGQAKHHDLSGGDVLAAEAPVNILRVGALVSVLPLVINQRMFVVVIMLVVMVMVMVMVMVVMMVVMVMMMIVRLALFRVRHAIHRAIRTIKTPDISWNRGSEVCASQPRPNHNPAMAITQTTAVWESVAARPSSTACFSVPRMATIKAAIIVFE